MVQYRYVPSEVGRTAEPASIYLVSEFDTLRIELEALLEPHYTLRLMTPQDVLRLSEREKEATLNKVAATLVDWNQQSPAVILAIQDTARRQAVPLVALCSSNEAEQVTALVVGADEALTRPLNPTLLQARLIAYQRLAVHSTVAPSGSGEGTQVLIFPDVEEDPAAHHEVFTVGPLRLDRSARRFFVDGHAVVLSPRGFDVMAYLMDQVGVCVSRDALLEHVWGVPFDPETNVVNVQIHKLRRTLHAYGVEGCIETVRRAGYRLVDATG